MYKQSAIGQVGVVVGVVVGAVVGSGLVGGVGPGPLVVSGVVVGRAVGNADWPITGKHIYLVSEKPLFGSYLTMHFHPI